MLFSQITKSKLSGNIMVINLIVFPMPLEIYVIFEQSRGKSFDMDVKNKIRFD